MMSADVRYFDLRPDIPMADDGSVLEVYADGLGALELLGPNFRATYFTWAAAADSTLVRRVPVIKVVRPVASFGRMKATLIAGGMTQH